VTETVGVKGLTCMLEMTGLLALAAASAWAFLWAATSSSKGRDRPSIFLLSKTLCDLHVSARVQCRLVSPSHTPQCLSALYSRSGFRSILPEVPPEVLPPPGVGGVLIFIGLLPTFLGCMTTSVVVEPVSAEGCFTCSLMIGMALGLADVDPVGGIPVALAIPVAEDAVAVGVRGVTLFGGVVSTKGPSPIMAIKSCDIP